MTKERLSQLDERMNLRDNEKTAIIYSMRNWQAYYMQPGVAISVDNHHFLEKAYLGAMAAHRRNEPSARLFSLATFMAIESRHLDTATDMLESAMGYRSFLKANEPFYYNVFSFLRAYLATIENRARAAKKYHKAFLARLKTSEYSPYNDVMIGQLHLAANEYAEGYDYFARAYSNGCRSIYLYEGLFRALSLVDVSQTGEELLPTLIYAARHGADISRATASHEDAVFAAIMQDPATGERLYTLSNHTPLLKPVCANRMHNKDYSLTAHKLYSMAVKQQVDLGGLMTFLVQSSYANHIEEIDSYPLERFLAGANMEPQLAAYVYHLLLTDPAHIRLIKGREDMILQAAASCLESDITGREANSLYQFYWAHMKSAGVTNDLVAKAEAELQAGLTQFELTTNKDTRFIYIALPERRGTHEYEVTGSRLIIEAPSDNFSHICLGAGRRSVITEPITIRKMTPLANPELYKYFFDTGDRRFYVLAYLASHYLETEKADTESIAVYEAILAEKSLHRPYSMKILAALGHLHHIAGNHAKALECYAQIDMSTLPQAYLQQAMKVCLQTREHALATEIIAQNHSSLEAQVVHEALHQLLDDNNHTAQIPSDMKTHLAEAAFNLLLNGYHSETLLTTALTHYHASQSELKALSRNLKNPDPRLDIKILSGDLWAHQCDTYTQKAFRRLLTANKAQEECAQFIKYCTCAMLTQNLVPEYEIINILEKHYLAHEPEHPHENQQESCSTVSSNTLLLLALSHLYLHHNISTFRSDKLLRKAVYAQEATGLLLPLFKENKPIAYPYLEKYQPFLYQDQPDKDIRLNYRLDNTKDFNSIPMQYLAYGLYVAKLPIFYNETVTYYYSDEMPTGSISTHQASHKNTTPYLHTNPQDDFFAINNAIIHEHMFRHQEVESIVDGLLKNPVAIQGQLL